jgi:hypothetical protein
MKPGSKGISLTKEQVRLTAQSQIIADGQWTTLKESISVIDAAVANIEEK